MTTIEKYREVERRMCAKADRDSRAFWIARALGCSAETRRYVDAAADRSHRAWERANDRLEAAKRAADYIAKLS